MAAFFYQRLFVGFGLTTKFKGIKDETINYNLNWNLPSEFWIPPRHAIVTVVDTQRKLGVGFKPEWFH